jgi:polar amino acid transport system substrate-binding protein
MAKYWLLFVLIICPIVLAEQGKFKVTVYAYHLQPPLIIDIGGQSGLYFDFVNHLNRLSNEYEFSLVYVPRKRIEVMLERNEMNGILLGVNPKWFKDRAEQKYLWTSIVFEDRDEIVSLQSAPFEYQSPNSLKGKTVGGVRGFYYAGINELVAQGLVNRIDTVDEEALLTMLTKQRIDVAIIGRFMYEYYLSDSVKATVFHLSAEPHDRYHRRILVPKEQSVLFLHLQDLVTKLGYDCKWQQKMMEYQ